MVVTFHFGVLGQRQMSKISTLWPSVFPILRQALPDQGQEIASIFHEWVYPNRPGNGMPPEV